MSFDPPITDARAPLVFEDAPTGVVANAAYWAGPVWRPTYMLAGDRRGFLWIDSYFRGSNHGSGNIQAELQFSDDGETVNPNKWFTIATLAPNAIVETIGRSIVAPFARISLWNASGAAIDFSATPMRAFVWRMRL